jgi:tRNA threonylcarbamoyladenosine biosynthesis protein TsaB
VLDPCMPSVLALETSTPFGSVAVVRDGAVIFERAFTSERSHNSQLFAPLREALDACGEGLRAVVVGTGPASYTGVRIGIAAAQGVALARGVPVCGLPSVTALKTPQRSDSYVFCGDARRGSFFVANVRDGAMAAINVLDAEGLRRVHAENQQPCPWFTFDPKPPLGLSDVCRVSPSATVLAERAESLSDAELGRMASQSLEPIYLAAPFITMPTK